MYSALQQIPLFSDCTPEQLETWLAQVPHRFETFAPGNRIVAQGTSVRSIFLLTDGMVRTQMAQEGRDFTLDLLEAPMLLASAFVFGTENTFPVSVEAITECQICIVNKEAFFDFMIAQPKVMRRFISDISDRTQFLSKKLRAFALQNLRSRVLDYLREHQPLESVQAAAQALGVLRPSLSRVLGDLQTDGVVVKTGEGWILT
ncbi:Crp/Fnr family transcriptional regulator [Alloprevotella sp. oral taxon 473]|jgi:hypothetical protein|uniref:Crp/Fnr family transcriptional regulator n=1 Tax=Alloprevotella sp. oral taxon 473 TaxID=712469 RepID=UPI0002A26527|nr:Crp/Fnr family transcriptional regulator [Alloprevotella sp. oral taxon 473]EKX91898.1 cyclic nucleotide-binding domain protein [Alloprevotella sp. oral taxon 473 str. F0040]